METRTEGPRGCGYRKPGGLYFVAPMGQQMPCGRMPIPLETCPTCSHGIKYTRGFTWINPEPLAAANLCTMPQDRLCFACPMEIRKGELAIGNRAGLLWIGRQFYATPQAYLAEAQAHGFSRRIKALPRGFEIGTHWLLLAHVEAVDPAKPTAKISGYEVLDVTPKRPGIFYAFRPIAVEYVVKGDETESELAALQLRGITPVEVIQRPSWEPERKAVGV